MHTRGGVAALLPLSRFSTAVIARKSRIVKIACCGFLLLNRELLVQRKCLLCPVENLWPNDIVYGDDKLEVASHQIKPLNCANHF